MIEIFHTYYMMIPEIFEQGFILCLVAMGMLIPFRFLDRPDLTCEGTYPLGGCLVAISLTYWGSSVIGLFLGVILGGLFGVLTAYLHHRLRIHSLLAGILVVAIIYTINLRIMGQSNLPLFQHPSFISDLNVSGLLTTLFIISLGVTGLIYGFLQTEKGLQFRLVGLNPFLAETQGINIQYQQYLGFFIGNALCALAGGIMVQAQAYADVGMGWGILINGLAALMLGEAITGARTIGRLILSPLVGACCFQALAALAMVLGGKPTDLKLITSLVIITTLFVSRRWVIVKSN